MVDNPLALDSNRLSRRKTESYRIEGTPPATML